MNNTLVTFIVPAHNEPKEKCAFIHSMLAQTSSNWKAIVFHNGPNEDMKNWIEGLKDSRIVYEESSIDSGAWGCFNRQTAINHIVDTPYVINTSVQDYWLPNAVQDIENILQSGVDLVHWQAINHLFRYNVLSGEIAFGHLDWGQWAIKTEYIKQVGIQNPTEFNADWQTLQGIIKTGLIQSAHKLNSILTIHN